MFAGSSSRFQSFIGSSKTVQLNDVVYELHKPVGVPSIQVVFFHGLLFEPNPHVSTWMSEDGSSVWPQTWLVEEFPEAHVLSLNFSGVLGSDNYVVEENLISDLLMANIGQVPNCPLVLVGHSFGGLVIKSLCCRVHQNFQAKHNPGTFKLQKFLENLRGIFYYSTPHHGSPVVTRFADVTGDPLISYFKVLSVTAARLNQQFDDVCQLYKWKCAGLGETLPTDLPSFMDLVGFVVSKAPEEVLSSVGNAFLVPEASARDGNDFGLVPGADHFSICRPRDKTSRSFFTLRNVLINIAVEMQQNLDMKAPSLMRRAHQVTKSLESASVIGIVGIAGIGKSSLAKVIFEKISLKFEYTCFVDNVDGMKTHELEDWVLRCFHRSGTKVDGNRTKWSDLKGRKTLIVLDGVDSEDQVRFVPKLSHFFAGSCLMITSRDPGIMKAFANCFIYEVDLLDFDEAKKLFCDYAFGQEGIPDVLMEGMVEQMVQKCNGLPLSLKVGGSYMRGLKANSRVWYETLNKLFTAEAVAGVGIGRPWNLLTVSFYTLSAAEQVMFIEAGTFFYKQPVEVALAAWSTAYKDSETTWATLIGKSMVKEVDKQEWDSSWQKLIEYKEVRVEEQLRDLADELSKGAMTSMSVREGERAVDLLNANQVHPNTTMLRLMCAGGRKLPTLQLEMLGKLSKLKYLEMDGVVTERSSMNFPRNLSVLKWISREKYQRFPVSLRHMNNLAVLELAGWWVIPEDFLEALGELTNLRILILSRMEGFHHFPEKFCNLSQLKRLELRDLNLTSLPLTIGNLSALEHLVLVELEVGDLAESFGNLTALKTLLIQGCHMLASLPDSITNLSSLKEFVIHNSGGLKCLQLPGLSKNLHSLPSENLSEVAYLGLHDCPSLESLPSNFGLLSSLEELVLDKCHQLKTLPESFGQVKTLRRLTILEAYHLQALPDSIGNLTALRYLHLKKCWSLMTLPESFGHLSALEEIEFEECSHLLGFRQNFGKLRALKKFGALTKVTFERIDYEGVLSEDFGNLLSLPHPSLKESPEELGFRFALQMLKLNNECGKSRGLTDDVGQLLALKSFIIKAPNNLKAILWQILSLEKLSLAEEFSFAVETLQRLPESIWKLPSIRKLSVLTSGAMEDSEHATLRSLEDAKIPSFLTEEGTCQDSDTMASHKELGESVGLIGMPHFRITDGKPPDVISWRPEMLENFIRGVNRRDEPGYFVCKTWLFSLQEHEHEEIMLILRRSWYIETYQTTTTMFYERMEDDVQVPNTCIDPAHTTDHNDICGGDTKQVIASDDSSALGDIDETLLNAEKRGGTFDLTSTMESGYFAVSEAHVPLSLLRAHSAPGSASALSNETYLMEASSSLLDDQAETSLPRSDEILMSLTTAVQNSSLYNYCINTHWLSTLEDHQIKDLYAIFSKAGYSQKYKTITTTYFEYTRGHAPSNPVTNTEKKSTVDDKDRPREVQQREDILLSDNQGQNRVDGWTNVTQASPKADVKCCCPPEPLTASFERRSDRSDSPESPSTSSSQGQHVSTRSVRRRISSEGQYVSTRLVTRRGLDCNVEIPSRKKYTMPTSVDTDIFMKTVEWDGTSGWKEVGFSLNVRVATALRCCLRSDYNNRRVRIQLTKIGGALDMDSESSHVNTHTLVLKAVRANLRAYVNNRLEVAEDSEGIHLEGLPQRKVLKDFCPSDDKYQSRCPRDLLWLERAEKYPENSKIDSATVELQCHVRNRLLHDAEVSGHNALVLDYSGGLPVNFEGDIFGDLDQNSFLELELRYQSEISYIEPQIPLPPPETPYGIFTRVEKVVDYDCLIKLKTQPIFVS